MSTTYLHDIRESEPFAVGSEGKPGRGLTVDLAEAIIGERRFAQDAGGRLYYYERGAYRPGGERLAKRRVKALLSDWGMLSKWSSYRAREVVKYISADAPELWERPPLTSINLLNGIYNVETGELEAHTPDHLSTVQLPVAYDPEATCPAWEKQVNETFPEDATELAWEIAAALMQPDRSEQKAILLTGEGSNGKSVYLENISGFIGKGNRAAQSLHRIEADRFAASQLVGKLANICPDLPSAHLAGTSMFKAIVGGDEIVGERKYQDAFGFTPFARLIFSANHMPGSHDATHAFFRRWLVVPFNRTFEGREVVPRKDLDTRLQDPTELSGLLNKALQALPRLRRQGFTESRSMREAWQEFRKTTDPLAVWLDRETVEGPSRGLQRQCWLGGSPHDDEQSFRADPEASQAAARGTTEEDRRQVGMVLGGSKAQVSGRRGHRRSPRFGRTAFTRFTRSP